MKQDFWLKAGKLFVLGWSLLILMLCLMPSDDLPKKEWLSNLDKVAHFVFYFVLSVAVLFVCSVKKAAPSAPIVIAFLFACSYAIELLQLLLPINRSFSYFDLVANLLGLLVGWLLFWKVIGPSSQLFWNKKPKP